jgi:N-acetylglucosaminyl-diphospho-decaprenol L-rhamnosyltransferase
VAGTGIAGAGTAIYVSFRTPTLDLSWLPADADVIVVHNDESLDRSSCAHPRVRHVGNGDNVGFGAAVNLALPLVSTARVALVNPDTQLAPEHWLALMEAPASEIVVVPLVDGKGRPTSMVSAFPTPASLVLTAYRVGRWFPRGGRGRRALAPLLGRWGRAHSESLDAVAGGSWPASERWASGAVVSYDVARLREVGAFDEGYFLYLEDTDLGRRLAARFRDLRVRLAGGTPGVHTVGGSAAGSEAWREAQRRYTGSAIRYASSQAGPGWRAARAALAARARWLARA